MASAHALAHYFETQTQLCAPSNRRSSSSQDQLLRRHASRDSPCAPNNATATPGQDSWTALGQQQRQQGQQKQQGASPFSGGGLNDGERACYQDGGGSNGHARPSPRDAPAAVASPPSTLRSESALAASPVLTHPPTLRSESSLVASWRSEIGLAASPVPANFLALRSESNLVTLKSAHLPASIAEEEEDPLLNGGLTHSSAGGLDA